MHESFMSRRLRAIATIVALVLLFEAKVGDGKLLVSTLRLRPAIDQGRPEAAYLFERMLRYVAGDQFNPQTQLDENTLRVLSTP